MNVAGWSRYIRASMLEVLRQDYVRTARAKGLVERVVIMKHALRNGLIPFITLVVFTLPALVGGAIITETIFSWPGMGRLYFLALGDSDYPVAMAILFIIAVLTVIATLLRDILYTVVDPRIQFLLEVKYMSATTKAVTLDADSAEHDQRGKPGKHCLPPFPAAPAGNDFIWSSCSIIIAGFVLCSARWRPSPQMR